MSIITQRTGSDCVLASIAMCVGQDYDTLWTPEDTQWCVDNRGIGDLTPWLSRAGFTKDQWRDLHAWNQQVEGMKNMLWGRPALLSVPSLNIERGSHMVYWDGERVLDPSPKKTYTWIQHVFPTSICIFTVDPKKRIPRWDLTALQIMKTLKN